MTHFQTLKRAIVDVVGRDRTNRLVAPFHDYLAVRRTDRFLKTLPKRGLRVNLGCGWRPLPGWINVDRARGPHVQVVWDLRSRLPFADGSCSALFSEHVIEHLSKEDGFALIKECYRILEPSGVLRLSTPDAGRYLRSYASDGLFLEQALAERSADTAMDRINLLMREGGQHLWVYDSVSLQLLLRKAGFSATTEREFAHSGHEALRGIDCPERAYESLYIEGVKHHSDTPSQRAAAAAQSC